ncbi:MAG TPA: 2Fe-2S iron-sulfur cluster-binding protein, partial [Xanthobacteraceae bacterium]|nr:2Fe-2S iron-sulfur cluster-binding protein [Xanthobacteraceae bacterium]
EGLSAKGDHPLQKAWILEQVPQCGYCQSGQIMQAASLLSKNPNPTKDEVVAHMDGNLCRCMTYSRSQKAIMRAASEMRTASNAGTERRAT